MLDGVLESKGGPIVSNNNPWDIHASALCSLALASRLPPLHQSSGRGWLCRGGGSGGDGLLLLLLLLLT